MHARRPGGYDRIMTSLRLFALGTAALLSGCGLSDLRPEPLINNQLPDDSERRGRVWLDKAVRAHGATLDDRATVSIWLRDDWPSTLLRWVAMPWEENKQLLRLDATVGGDNGRLTFEEGPAKGTGWGIQNWVTYRFGADGGPTFDAVDDPDDAIKFWIPTLAYFPLLPWRIREATYVRYVGEETIDGRKRVTVFATWGDPGPQEAIDQYLVWIDAETHLVAGTRYTVRDMMGSVVGTMKYSDYRDVDGIKLPFVINGVEALGTDETESHRMTVERVAFDAVPTSALVPRPELQATK